MCVCVCRCSVGSHNVEKHGTVEMKCALYVCFVLRAS